MKITRETTVSEAIVLLKEVDFLDQLEDKFIPVDIPEMTYGQRVDLMEIKTWSDLIFIPQRILRLLSDKAIMTIPFYAAYNFGRSVMKELERQSDRDNKAFAYNPSSEEVKAGYYDLNHGIFGTVDKIAQRIHISHDEVFDLPEKRVFAMLKIDFDNMMYSKRLNQIISKKK